MSGGDDNGLFVALLCHIRLSSPSHGRRAVVVVSMDSERRPSQSFHSTDSFREAKQRSMHNNILLPPTQTLCYPKKKFRNVEQERLWENLPLYELKLVGQFSRSMVKYSKAATRDSRRMLLPVHVCPRCLLLFLDPYLKFPSLMMMRLISPQYHIVRMHFRIGYITFHERERVSPPSADFICATGTT